MIKRALTAADVSRHLEHQRLCHVTGASAQMVAPWKAGHCLVWDFTCPDTLAASHLNCAVTGGRAIATEAEAKKKLKYSRLYARQIHTSSDSLLALLRRRG